jgi:DNA-binding NtrC family response regulator
MRTIFENLWGGLRKNGYTVLEARNGIEALQVAKHHDGPIHLLMTDVVMPKMGGWKLAERLITLRPALAVVYLSGYSEYSAASDDSSKWRASFVQKPFAMDALARKIREVLSPDRR